MTFRIPLKVVDLGTSCLLYQLRLEEALHRRGLSNWLVWNRASPTEASIVLGTSGVVSDLVHVDNAARDRIRLIRRFTGGGTVFIDRHTILISFIMGGILTPMPSPRAIMDWSKDLYADVFHRCSISGFHLLENDYCLGEKKFGGNAQTLSRKRWVHHTSILWQVNFEAMSAYLRSPKRQPTYRQQRNHSDFLCGIGQYIDDQHEFEQAFMDMLYDRFDVETVPLDDIVHVMDEDHRRATCEVLLDSRRVQCLKSRAMKL